MDLRVMTYNILNTSCRYDERKHLMLATISESQADIIALQEVNSRNEVDLRMENYAFHFSKGIRPSQKHADPGFCIEGVATMTGAKVKVESVENLFFDDDYKLAQKLRTTIGPHSLCVVNTHLNYTFGDTLRSQQVSALLSWLSPEIASNEPLLCIGDFNFNNTSVLYDRMREYFQSAYCQANRREPVLTFPTGLHGEFSDISRHEAVDFIWVRGGVRTIRAKIVGEKGDVAKQLWGSDHYGVLADLVLGE